MEKHVVTHSFDRIRAAIAADLRAALKSRDRIAVAALRGALDTMDNATAPPAPPGAAAAPEITRHLPCTRDLAAALKREIDTRASAADEYQRLGKIALAGDFRLEADVIRRCLRHFAVPPGGIAP